MAFDIAAARKDGVPESAIAEYLAKQSSFDLDTARKDGVPDSAIADYLAGKSAPAQAKPSVEEKPVSQPGKAPDTKWGIERTGQALLQDVPVGIAQGVVNTTRSTVKSMGGQEPPSKSIQELVAKQLLKITNFSVSNPNLPNISLDIAKYVQDKFGLAPDNNDVLKGVSEYLQSLKSKGTQELEAYSPTNPEDSIFKRAADKAAYMATNPSTISTGLAETVGPMGEAGIFAKALKPTNLSLGSRLAAGEAGVAGLSTAQAIRDQQEGKPLTPGQHVAVAANMVLTGLFSKAGGAAANYLGVGDLDAIFAQEMAGQISSKVAQKEIASRVGAALKSGAVESGVEELPQSVVDQISLNVATGKPAFENVPEAGVEGALTAFPLGSAAGAYQQQKINQRILGEAEYKKSKTEKEDWQNKQDKVNEKIDTQTMTADEKRNYKLKQAGKPVPLTLEEKEAEEYVTGTNAQASGAGADLSGEPDAAESAAGAGGADRSRMAGAGINAGAAASGTNAQPTTLSATEQPIVDAATQAGVTFSNPSHARNWVIKHVLKGDKAAASQLEKTNPGIYKRLFETSKQTAAAPVPPAFNEAELQEAGELAKDETPIEGTPLRTASPEALAAKARRDTWLGKSPEEIAAQRAEQVEKSPLEEVENQQAEAEALAEKLVPSEEVSEEAAVETAPKAEEVLAEEEVAAEPVKNEAEILQEQKDKEVVRLKTSLGKIAGGLSKPGRMNIVPEEEVDYLKEVTTVFSAAIELGNVSFQQASAYVAEQLKEYGLTLDDIKDYLEEAYSRASAGLRSKAKQKQEAELENKQIAFAADEPARAKILDQNEAERIEQNAYPFIAVDTKSNAKEIEGFNYNRKADPENKFRGWDKLSAAQQVLYSIINRTRGPNAAIKALNDFSKDKAGKYESITDVNAVLYELNKEAAAKEHQIEFPLWQELSKQAQDNFLQDLPKISTRLKEGQEYFSQSGTALHNAFERVAEQLEKENVGYRGKKQIDIENAELALQSEQAKGQYQATTAKEKAAEKEAVGKGVDLSQDVVDMLEEGNINGVLRELLATARGIAIKGKVTITGKDGIGAFGNYLANQHRKATAYLYRSLAEQLSKIDFQSTVITDIKNPIIVALRREGKLAEYDPKTDTFYFTPEGLDEATVLHEVVHAATVRLISRYLENPQSLTKTQREAIEHIEKLFDFTKPRLNGRFPNAFENLYEFVAYALTDSQFQFALSNIQARSLAKFTVGKLPSEFSKLINAPVASAKNILNQFTEAIMKLYGIVTGSGYGLYMKPYLHEQLRKDSLVSGKETFRVVRIEDLSPAEQEKHEDTLARLAENVKTAEEKEIFSRVYSQVMQEGGLDDITGQELKILNKSITARLKQIQKLKDAAEKKAAEKKAAEKKAQAEDKGSTSIEVDEEILAGYKKGYEGNALFELTELFNTIIAAPVAGTQVDPLAARRIQIPQTPRAASRQDRVKAMEDELKTKQVGESTITILYGHLKNPRKVYRAMVRRLQSNVQPLQIVQRNSKMANKLEQDMTNVSMFNDSYSQAIKAMSRAYTITAQTITPLENEISKLIINIKKEATEFNPQELMRNLQLWYTGLHEPERRRWLFMKNVPLSSDVNYLITVAGKTDTPANHRDRLIAAFENLRDTPGGMTALEKADVIRERLDELIFEIDPATGKAMTGDLMSADASQRAGKLKIANMDKNQLATNPNRFLENHNDQSVVGGYTAEKINDLIEELNSKPYKQQVMDLYTALKKVQEVTATLNLQSNFYTQSNLNYIQGSGYKWYIPFKGRPELEEKTTSNGFGDDQRYSSDLQFGESVAGGRESTTTNPISQILVDAKKAAYILAHQPVTQSVVNNIKQGNIGGKKIKTISYADRYKEGLEKDRTTIWLNMPDGRVEVWKIEDQAILEALRKPYKQYSEVLYKNIMDTWSGATRLVGQGFTLFNIKFAPGNAVKDFIPNLFYIGSEYGFTPAVEYFVNMINTVSADTVVGGGAFSAGTAMYHYQNGNFDALKAKAKTDEFTRYFLELALNNGIVTFAQGISTNIESNRLETKVDMAFKGDLNPKKIATAAYNHALIPFEYWMHMSEVSVRVTAYKTVKDHLVANGVPEQEAISEASTFTKEVANFEQSGTSNFASNMARLYAFTRSTATGTVRFFRDLGYILPYATSSAVADLPDSIKKDPVALANFKKNFQTKQTQTAIMAGVYIGLGMAIYTMSLSGSEDDELGRNKIENDDPALWTRAMRFFLPEMKNPIQIPTGYGPGSLISIGSQIGILAYGNQTKDEFVDNMFTIIQDSYSPIQMSKIPISEDPFNWALDTISPTVFKGAVESAINKNGLGMQIVLDSMGNEPQAFTSHGNVPEYAKWAAETLNRETRDLFPDDVIDISPNTIYHLLSNYVNGIVVFADLAERYTMISTGEREYDITTENPVVDAFVGRPSRPDSRETIRLQKQIDRMEVTLKSAEIDPKGNINEYEAKRHRNRQTIDDLRRFTARLDKLRHERKLIEQNASGLKYNEKQKQLEYNTRNQDFYKAEINRSLKIDNPLLRTAKDRDMN